MNARLKRLIAITFIAICTFSLAVSSLAIQSDNRPSANNGTVLLLSDDPNQEIGLVNIASGPSLSDGCSVFALDSGSFSPVGAIQYDANSGNTIAYRIDSNSLYQIVECNADKNTITYLADYGFFIKVSGSYRKESEDGENSFELFNGSILLKNIKKSLYPQLAVDDDRDLLDRLENTGKFALRITDKSVLVFSDDWVASETELNDEYLEGCRLTMEQFEERFPLATPMPTQTPTSTQAVTAEPTSVATATMDVKPTDNPKSEFSEEDIASIKTAVSQELKRSMLPVILLCILGLIGLLSVVLSLLHQKKILTSVSKKITTSQRDNYAFGGKNRYYDTQPRNTDSEIRVDTENLATKKDLDNTTREILEEIGRLFSAGAIEQQVCSGDSSKPTMYPPVDTSSRIDNLTEVEKELIRCTDSIVGKGQKSYEDLGTVFTPYRVSRIRIEEDGSFTACHQDTEYCLISCGDEYYVIARANRCGLFDKKFDTIYERRGNGISRFGSLPRLCKDEKSNRYILVRKGRLE